MDLSIQILFSSDDSILHILSKDYSLNWLFRYIALAADTALNNNITN